MKKYFLLLAILATFQVSLFSQSTSDEQYKQALRREIDSLKKVLPSLHDTARISCLNSLAEEYLNNIDVPFKARADSASLYAMQANKEAIRIGNKYGLAKSLINLILPEHLRYIVKAKSGIRDSASRKTEEQFVLQAIALGEELGNDEILAEAYQYQDCIDEWEGHLTGHSQFEDEKKTIYYSQRAGNEKIEGAASLWLSSTYYKQGNYEESFEYGQKALKLNKKIISTPLIGRGDFNFLVQESLYNLSLLYSAAGDNETALNYLRESHLFGIANNTGWTFETEMGELFRQIGQYDSSFYYLLKFTKENPGDLGKTFLGNTYLSTKQYDKALNLFHEVIDSARRSKSLMLPIKFYFKEALIGAAKAYMAKKDYKTALRYAKEGVGLSWGNQPLVMDNSELLSDIYHYLGKNDSAYFYLKKYITLKDSILNKQLLMRLNNYKSQVEIDKKESQLALLNKDNKIKEQQLKQEGLIKKVLIAGLILFSLIGIFVFRTLTLKRKNEKLGREQLENEMKVQQLESEKKQSDLQRQAADLEMQALRAQMNPHFIFNCLSSINKFILKNESRTASDYLTRFSRLIRMVLTNSQLSMIPLSDEIEVLRLYLDMERLRFSNSFNYNIVYANAIEPETIYIPPMILQPFCENAIWHGLMHKEGQGRLDIVMSIQNNQLQCTIADNGIGRTKAAELKSKSGEKQKSFGLKITTERLALFNNEKTVQTFYNSEDVLDTDGNIAGTEVTLHIKYKNEIHEPVS